MFHMNIYQIFLLYNLVTIPLIKYSHKVAVVRTVDINDKYAFLGLAKAYIFNITYKGIAGVHS